MDVFRLRDQLIDDFWSYTSSFLKICPQISTYVDSSIEKGLLWPES